jgi:hypothetical protein
VPQLSEGDLGQMLPFMNQRCPLEMASKLKRLQLPHSVVSEKGLNAILSATPFLADLKCDLHYTCSGAEFAYCDGVKLLAALSQVSGTLRLLKLTFGVQPKHNLRKIGYGNSDGFNATF